MIRTVAIFLFLSSICFAKVQVGADVFFEEGIYKRLLKGKRVGLVSNQTALTKEGKTTLELLLEHKDEVQLTALFAPEHGFYGNAYAYEDVKDKTHANIPIFSLHGETRRPTAKMLSHVDLLIFDVQDIGSRSYTYISTLFYCMEEAKKHDIAVVVLDRPNPMGGHVVDGPLLQEELRSFIGYVNVPYCHGMTVAELALLFNAEYKIACALTVIPMKGYKRGTPFKKTDLTWVPTSPQIPEGDTPFYYPTTGLIGHLSLVSIGIGYTLPFKLIGAPWIEAETLANKLNEEKLPGVYFRPYYYRPFFGKFKLEDCQGVRIVISDPNKYLPMTTQYTILGVLKRLYPEEFTRAVARLESNRNKRDVFDKLNGNKELLHMIKEDAYIIWKLRTLCEEGRKAFAPIRKKYLLPNYN